MKIRRGLGIALLGAGLAVVSCSADRGTAYVGADASTSTASAAAVVESGAAATRITELRGRFRLPVRAPEDDRPGLAHAAPAKPLVPTTRAALGAPVATRFEAAAGADAATHVRAVLPADALRGVTRAAHVALPVRADGEVKLEDDTSHVSVGFVLEHVQDARIEVAGGMAIYRGALDGADVVHRVHAEGTEDFVVFETRPAREELSYSVDVSRVPGLRLVSNTLEFLDDTGTPVLRVAPPYVVDATGARHDAKLAVAGCAYDVNPAGPWGREVTRPRSTRCTVRVGWGGDVAYPAMVDPAWGATGSMATARGVHTASVLPSGKVLIAGGCNVVNCAVSLSSAELFDPAGVGTFAATGSMATARNYHTANVLPSGKVLVAGGYGANHAPLSSAELFDPAGNAGAGTFSAAGSMAAARADHTASLLASGKLLVTGGDNGAYLASAEIFDPAGNAGAGTFAPTGAMAVARAWHTASLLPSGKVLVAGGHNGSSYNASAELFDPTGNAGAGTFAATGSMATARYQHTASALPSGKVLVAGGNNPSVASAEVFDPAGNAGAGTFVATGSMAAARYSHTAIALPSGKVLVAGGCNGNPCASLSSAELFDPAGNAGAGAFVPTGFMVAARFHHRATLLASDKVLVTGGYDGGFLQSAELYGGALGDACAVNGSCLSGFCADGFCCSSACGGGGCDRCDLAGKEGTCSVAPSGDPGADSACAFPLACDGVNSACPTSCASDAACASAYFCSSNGKCEPRKAQASACNTQTDCRETGCRECVSGFCVDGFCCDTACNGTCEACAAALKYSGAPDGKCGSARSGLDPGGVVCAVPQATCDGDHTNTGTDGKQQDCSPYKCANDGTCRAACASVAECVAPTICDATGKCVPPPADTESGGGCAVAGRGAFDDRSGLVWVALGLGMVVRRTRANRGEKAVKR